MPESPAVIREIVAILSIIADCRELPNTTRLEVMEHGVSALEAALTHHRENTPAHRTGRSQPE